MVLNLEDVSYDLDINSVKVVFGRGTSNYQEIVDRFDLAEYIFISTYNISGDKTSEEFLNKLQALSDKDIIFISNIPGRFLQYFGDASRKSAKKKIHDYLNRLDPIGFQSCAKVYFNFFNHSKIIITDDVAYIGSANFSDESSNNFEAGIIIYDKAAINTIRKNIVPIILNSSVRYAGEELQILDEFYKYLSEIQKKLEEFNEVIYLENPHGDLYISIWAEGFGDLIDVLKDVLDNFRIFIELNLDIINKYEELELKIVEKYMGDIQDLLENEFLQELAEVNSDDIMSEYISEHGFEAVEPEEVNKLAEDASFEATEIKEAMIEKVAEPLKQLQKQFACLIYDLEDAVRKIESIEQLQERIDNTSL